MFNLNPSSGSFNTALATQMITIVESLDILLLKPKRKWDLKCRPQYPNMCFSILKEKSYFVPIYVSSWSINFQGHRQLPHQLMLRLQDHLHMTAVHWLPQEQLTVAARQLNARPPLSKQLLNAIDLNDNSNRK